MPNTRYASAGADPDAAPERHLSSAKLRGIQIGLNVIVRVAKARTLPEARAMIWVHNYARLRKLTADALCDELNLDKAEIRAALTDPDADLTRFTREVARVRAAFEKSLPSLYATEVTKTVRKGFRYALEKHAIAEVVGRNRMGKTDTAEIEYWKNLDRCVWLNTPDDETDRNFIFELARVLGIGTTGGKKVAQVRPQVVGVFDSGLIDVLIVDEGHFLWPSDIWTKPKRIEFLRCSIHRDGAVGVLVLATPQYNASMLLALGSTRWAPGQWDGRRVPFYLRDTMSTEDLRGVARQHAPEFPEAFIDRLVEQARASEGFCGLMVNTIELARFEAEMAEPPVKAVTRDILERVLAQMARGSRIEQLAKQKLAGQKQPGKPNGHARTPVFAHNGRAVAQIA